MTGPFVDEGEVAQRPVKVPCPCVGTPHESDEVYIRTELAGFEIAKIQGSMFTVTEEGKPAADLGASNLASMEACVVGWTFTFNGVPIPFDKAKVNKLRADIWQMVLEEVDKVTEGVRPLGKEKPATGSDNTSTTESLTSAPESKVFSPSSLTVSRTSASREPSSS